MPEKVEPTLAYAQKQDREDELHGFRSRFYFPRTTPGGIGGKLIYFCGNSLGLQPREAEDYIRQELVDWRDIAIDGYWHARNPWMTYPAALRGPLAKITGALEEEITVMNALTVNLHLLLTSFYRPSARRYKLLVEAGAFPSDQYAVETQVRWHGYDPALAIIEVGPRPGERLIREDDIVATIREHKDSLAVVLLGGVNYYTGQLFDMAAITAAAHEAGALAGFDLAHAVGNVSLRLHDWDVDFAVWCSYKYLNGGPGAVGGAFLHERFVRDTSLPRLGGWWGNDEMASFEQDNQSLPTGQASLGRPKGFLPKPTAEGWSMSTAQVFNMVCLKASLAIFEEAGFERLHAKSVRLTGYLYALLEGLRASRPAGSAPNNPAAPFDIVTPAEPKRRGAQLSLYFGERGKNIQQRLAEQGVIVDYREPGVIRVSPAPLYNSFEDVYRFYHILGQLV
ncbi:MAG TPA: kynureninase [Puia sp.]|nr:kynureninase [Puia sp.]